MSQMPFDDLETAYEDAGDGHRYRPDRNGKRCS